MKRLLWVGDGPDVPSGFGRATREILDVLRDSYEITVLEINVRGDPGTVPYPVWSAAAEGDAFGTNRLLWMCSQVQPDIIVVQQDGWNVPAYMKQMRLAPTFKEYARYATIPVVAAVAVDGQSFQGAWLDGVAGAVFWTEWALAEARRGGFAGPAAVIPLGVDISTYHPIAQADARHRRGLDPIGGSAFIVGNVNRNQPRKRLDLTIRYFAEWVYGGVPVGQRVETQRAIQDAYLYLHVAPTGDMSVGIQQLAQYYGVLDRLALMQPQTFYGIPDDEMVDTYNSFDVCINTGQGEGMWLPGLEAMACGVPVIAGDWSGLSDWAKDAAWLVPCTSTAIGPPYVNVIGGVPDERQFVMALHRLYTDRTARAQNGQAALERAREDRFRWATIGRQWDVLLTEVLAMQAAESAAPAQVTA